MQLGNYHKVSMLSYTAPSDLALTSCFFGLRLHMKSYISSCACKILICILINIRYVIFQYMLLLLLSRFSHVQLCVTPQMALHQAPPSLEFSRQEHWSGLPFPSPMHESENENEVAQSCPTLQDPMDCSLPGSSVHGICQARVLEWVAIAFFYSSIYLTIY